ncbi:extracellular solute-binding protein [Eisenbergiella sp.]
MKKNVLKKIMAAALSGAMAIGLLACGSAADTANTDTSTGSTAESGTEGGAQALAGDAEVYWFSDVTGWGPNGWEKGVASSPLLDAIKEKTGVTFTIEQPPTDADTKLGLMIASNDLPDLISITDADTIKQLIQSGKVWSIEEFLQQYDPQSHLLTDFPEDIKTAVVRKFSGWYSIPSHMCSNDNRKVNPPSSQIYVDNVTKGHNSAIMFNQTIMDALGITQEDVQTEEGFYKACELVKNSGYTVDGQSVFPVMLHADKWITSSLDGIIAENFGVAPVDADGNFRHKEMNPGYKNALKFVNNLIRNGYLDINSLTIDEAALKTYIEGGRVFCWIGNPAQSSKKETVPFVSYGPILADNGARPIVPISLQAGSGWIQTFVSKDCKNPEQIAKMLSFATSREGMFLNEYGVEGVDYTLDENGIATRTEEGNQKYETDYKKNIALWPFANTDFAWSTQAPPAEGTDGAVFNQVSTAIGKYESTYIFDSDLLSFLDGNVVEPSSDLGIKVSQVKSYLESQKAKIVSASTQEQFEKEYESMLETLKGYSIEEIDTEYNKTLQQNYEAFGETIENVNTELYEK